MKANSETEMKHKDPGWQGPELPPLTPLRTAGNEAFRVRQFKAAIQLYTRAIDTQEHEWVLACSNRAICFNKLDSHLEALADSLRVVALRPEFDKAYNTMADAAIGVAAGYIHSKRWREAFAVLRSILGCEVQQRLTKEKRAELHKKELCWRTDRNRACIIGFQVNYDDFERESPTSREAMLSSFPEALDCGLKLMKQSMEGVSVMHVVGARSEECPRRLAKMFTSPRAKLVMIDPQIDSIAQDYPSVVQTETSSVTCHYEKSTYEQFCNKPGSKNRYSKCSALQKADVAVLFCPKLSRMFDSWMPAIQALVDKNVLTFITGYNRDQSLIENEDLLNAVGARVVLHTEQIPKPYRVLYRNNMTVTKNYHICAFQGRRTRIPPSLLGNVKQGLIDRGFEIGEPSPLSEIWKRCSEDPGVRDRVCGTRTVENKNGLVTQMYFQKVNGQVKAFFKKAGSDQEVELDASDSRQCDTSDILTQEEEALLRAVGIPPEFAIKHADFWNQIAGIGTSTKCGKQFIHFN